MPSGVKRKAKRECKRIVDLHPFDTELVDNAAFTAIGKAGLFHERKETVGLRPGRGQKRGDTGWLIRFVGGRSGS